MLHFMSIGGIAIIDPRNDTYSFGTEEFCVGAE
jgi:hypothetical protein